jgi:hypothetical protein
MPPKLNIEQHFVKHVLPVSCGCTIWLGPTNEHGYGTLPYRGRISYAHRVRWVERKGPIPKGLNVLHRCDVPACVNVEHLWLGTQADNNADREAKGRGRGYFPKGDKHFKAKLTEAQVLAIRADLRTSRAIAHAYGIEHATVQAIKHRRSWRHLP